MDIRKHSRKSALPSSCHGGLLEEVFPGIIPPVLLLSSCNIALQNGPGSLQRFCAGHQGSNRSVELEQVLVEFIKKRGVVDDLW